VPAVQRNGDPVRMTTVLAPAAKVTKLTPSGWMRITIIANCVAIYLVGKIEDNFIFELLCEKILFIDSFEFYK